MAYYLRYRLEPSISPAAIKAPMRVDIKTKKASGRLAIRTDDKRLRGEGTLDVELPKPADGRGKADVQLVIGRYRSTYCILGMSGVGLLGARGLVPFYRKTVADALEGALTSASGQDVRLREEVVANRQFSRSFWDEITSIRGYDEDSDLTIQASSQDLDKILGRKGDNFLAEFYARANIKSIRGRNARLPRQEDKATPGSFAFDARGLLRWEPLDVDVVEAFFRSLISQGFDGEAKS